MLKVQVVGVGQAISLQGRCTCHTAAPFPQQVRYMWTQGRFKTRRTPAHVARKTPDPRTKESYTVVGEIMPIYVGMIVLT